MTTPWTPERVEMLRRLWAEGNSASVCAREIDGDFSRSAIIGKVYRLGLSHSRPAKPKVRVSSWAARKARRKTAGKQVDKKRRFKNNFTHWSSLRQDDAPAAPGARLASPDVWKPLQDIQPATQAQLSKTHCRWPVEDETPRYGLDRLFCGAPADVAHPYCSTHAAHASSRRAA